MTCSNIVGMDGEAACPDRLWIKGVYLVDNFWPVDKLWIVKKCEVIHRLPTVAEKQQKKLSTAYPQWLFCHNLKLSTAFPQSYAHKKVLI